MTVGFPIPERIARLFAEGLTFTGVLERGLAGGWRRDQVLEVLRARNWVLDASGRLPREQRPAVTPGKPLPRAGAGLAPSPSAPGWGAERAAPREPRRPPGGVSPRPYDRTNAQVGGVRLAGAPLSAVPSPRNGAPPPSITPLRAPAGSRPGPAEHTVDVELLLVRAAGHELADIRHRATRIATQLETLRGKLAALDARDAAAAAADAARTEAITRLAAIEDERERLRTQLGKNPSRPLPPIKHGTWGGYQAERKRNQELCPACVLAKDAHFASMRAARRR